MGGVMRFKQWYQRRVREDKKEDEKQKGLSYDQLYPSDVGDTGRLFVRNLVYGCTEDDLRTLFSQFGEISEIHMPIDKKTGGTKGYAFVLFMIPFQATEAQKKLDGKSFQGRLLHILPAREPREKLKSEHEEGTGGYTSKFQKEKAAKLKKEAGRSEMWNPLFMRSDAVIDAMSAKYNVDKLELLDPASKDMALRQALGETNVIAETKEFLISEGISPRALGGIYEGDKKGIRRSGTILLVKNIPFSTEESQLKNLFEKFGTVGRVVLPPWKTLALVEFTQPAEARVAFKQLAFREFKGAPLFLEWAPMEIGGKDGTTTTAATSTATTATSTATGTATATTSSSSGIHGASKDQLIKKEEEEMENLSGSSQNTLYVKNLNWDTDEATLKDHFSKFGKIRSLTIAKKRDMKKEGKLLSLGYGFVEFNEREEAMEAFKKLQGELLDGHSLEISFSQKGQREKSNLDRKQTQREKKSNKLMVKNVPFQANENELRKLFSTYGELKVVRLPWRQGGKRHRGFAFVEYLTKEEATNAMEMLANTHLYGRHLVIDYAKEEEGLEDVREKTKRLFKQI
eukprot:TRINITY_DN7426_c0_g1_i3.p1 TRINITY_DN7426_c0_g1~~TRINITY_DN7426_c0_g1_i3.p1  ORF type:complete len:571 (-),score=192.41 TRINITY_DN7426_c0_g1_i3:186-1898(-)